MHNILANPPKKTPQPPSFSHNITTFNVSLSYDLNGNIMTVDRNARGTATQGSLAQHEEGRYRPNGSEMIYEYNLTDHLGNTRITFGDADADGLAEILQENQYYPFGMAMTMSSTLAAAPPNNYLYNGKELQDELDLGWYDYGARMYDASIGRFNSIDNFIEKYPYNGGYNYALNDPVRFVEVNGDSVWVLSMTTIHDNGDITTVHIFHFTGKVLIPNNLTLANSVAEGLSERLYTSNTSFSVIAPDGVRFTHEFYFAGGFQGVSSMDEVSAEDHLLVGVNDVLGKGDPAQCNSCEAAGLGRVGGQIGYFEMGVLYNMIETAFHEFGHNLGLEHPNEENREPVVGNPMSYHSSGNGKPYSTEGLLRLVDGVDFFNNGVNSVVLKQDEVINTFLTNEKPYLGSPRAGTRIPYPLINDNK